MLGVSVESIEGRQSNLRVELQAPHGSNLVIEHTCICKRECDIQEMIDAVWVETIIPVGTCHCLSNSTSSQSDNGDV